MNLRRRIAGIERQLGRVDLGLPPELTALPPEDRRRLAGKELMRAMETSLFQCRGTPSHCWELDPHQIDLAVQIILDEVYPNDPSPLDQPISDDEREHVERAVREQMGEAADVPPDPIRSYGRLLRDRHEAIPRALAL